MSEWKETIKKYKNRIGLAMKNAHKQLAHGSRRLILSMCNFTVGLTSTHFEEGIFDNWD